MRIAPVSSYVSQLVPLPKSFEERFGLYSVLRIPNVWGPRMSTSCTNWGDLNLDPSLSHVLLPLIELHWLLLLVGPVGFLNWKFAPNSFSPGLFWLRGTLPPITGTRTPWPWTLNMHTMVSPTTLSGQKEEPSSQIAGVEQQQTSSARMWIFNS